MQEEEQIEMASGGGNNFRDVVMNQFNKVTNFSNVEFRGGFYTKVPTKDGGEKEIYVQDSREVFSNACFALALLLQPKFNKDMIEYFGEFREEKEELTKKFIEATSVKEKVVLGEAFYESEKDKILLEEYKVEKLLLHLKLFANISEELSRHGYFEMTGATF